MTRQLWGEQLTWGEVTVFWEPSRTLSNTGDVDYNQQKGQIYSQLDKFRGSPRIPQPSFSWWQKARTSPLVLLTTRRQETGSRSPISNTSGHRHSKKRPLERSQSLKPVGLSRAPSGLRILKELLQRRSIKKMEDIPDSPSNLCHSFY